MHPKDRMSDSRDHDKTAPLEAVSSGSALFRQIFLTYETEYVLILAVL